MVIDSILFINEQFFPRLGGMELATYHLAYTISQVENLNVRVACSAISNIPRSYRYPFPVNRPKKASLLTPWLYKRNIHQMIRKHQVQLLHGQTLHGGGYHAMHAAQKFNIPFVVTSHGSDVQVVPEINYGAQLNPAMKQRMQEVIAHAAHIIAVSEMNKHDIIRLGADENQITVIPNGVQYNEIQAIPFEDKRKALGLADDDFVLITVGRNRPIKRMPLLFEAIQKCNNPKIKCICVGPKENLMELAKTYNIANQIIISERIPANPLTEHPPYRELINLYRSANMYVSTSYVESFGMAAADALACGTPVIVGKNHGIRDAIQEGTTGYSLTNDTAAELAELFNELYLKKEALRSLQKEISLSVKHLDWSKIAQRTIELYYAIVHK